MAAKKFALRAALVLAPAAVVISGLSRITFNIDILKLLPNRLGTVTGLALFARHFARPTELLVTIDAPDSDAAEKSAAALAENFRKRPDIIARVVSESPWQSHPQELAEFVAYLLINQPPDQFAALVEKLSPQKIGATLDETKETLAESFSGKEIGMASYDPLGLLRSLDLSRFASSSNLSEFSSGDGAFRVIYIEAIRPMPDYRVAIAWMDSIRGIVKNTALPDGVKIGLTGEPAFMSEISAQMQWDMKSSGLLTLIVIALIFYFCYRRLRPLAELITMLLVIFAITLGIAGWVLPQLTVIGVGFASIMIGLSVDYGYLIYRASLENRDPQALWRAAFPYIMWAAVTTAAAFLTLNASSLPGLNHLGNLVAIGMIVGAGVMLAVFRPLICRTQKNPPGTPRLERWLADPRVRRGGTIATGALVALLLGTLLVRGLPEFDSSSRVLKMRHSFANDALERVYAKLTDERDLISFVVTGRDEKELLDRLRALQPRLDVAEKKGLLQRALSPLFLCADENVQRANLPTAKSLLADRARLAAAVEKAGFREEALVLTKEIFDQWQTWSDANIFPIWPKNETSTWIMRRAVGREANGDFIATGILQPTPGNEDNLFSLQSEGVHLVSWPLLGRELRRVIPREFAIIIASLVSILLLLLVVAFRSVRDVALMTATMIVVFLALMGAMRLFGMTWNVFNLAAIMLLLGTGTDYSIYMILALKKNGGDIAQAQRSIGFIVILCATSAASGFGTLGHAAHLGLASLAQVCALGLALDCLISVFLLPPAWQWWRGKK